MDEKVFVMSKVQLETLAVLIVRQIELISNARGEDEGAVIALCKLIRCSIFTKEELGVIARHMSEKCNNLHRFRRSIPRCLDSMWNELSSTLLTIQARLECESQQQMRNGCDVLSELLQHQSFKTLSDQGSAKVLCAIATSLKLSEQQQFTSIYACMSCVIDMIRESEKGPFNAHTNAVGNIYRSARLLLLEIHGGKSTILSMGAAHKIPGRIHIAA